MYSLYQWIIGLGYQTSNELKSLNVLYLKVIYKPFQPKLETALSTITTIDKWQFPVWFPIIYFQKRLLGEMIFNVYLSFPMPSMLHTFDSNEGEQSSRPRDLLWSGHISGFWIHFMTREIILKAIFLLGLSARSSPVYVGPGWWSM